MRLGHYILNPDHTLSEVDLLTWGRWMEGADRLLFMTGNKDLFVSTVFMGLDHRFVGKGPPLLFETMVFRNHDGEECERYSSYDDAETGHKAMCRKVFRKVGSKA
jgi:hypothetical protein